MFLPSSSSATSRTVEWSRGWPLTAKLRQLQPYIAVNSPGYLIAGAAALDLMGYKRSPDRDKAARAWEDFVAANVGRFEQAGLPLSATQSIGYWDHMLAHGHVAHHEDSTGFRVENLTDEQYAGLIDLVESYFALGYEYFTPGALKPEDQARLTARFGP
jgi:hypothetical protein